MRRAAVPRRARSGGVTWVSPRRTPRCSRPGPTIPSPGGTSRSSLTRCAAPFWTNSVPLSAARAGGRGSRLRHSRETCRRSEARKGPRAGSRPSATARRSRTESPCGAHPDIASATWSSRLRVTHPFVFAADAFHNVEHVAHPEWDTSSDEDGELALATRRRVLGALADTWARTAITHGAGPHSFRVARDGSGGFSRRRRARLVSPTRTRSPRPRSEGPEARGGSLPRSSVRGRRLRP